jgi:hypothetical protein
MGSVGGRTPIEPKFYSLFFNFRHMEKDEVMRFVQL